ncbi:MAG: hypothetical protein Kow0099_04810 [Candidatus Abyssubacteria bacterium]
MERIIGDMVDSMGGVFAQTILPWAWEHKFWLAAFIPLLVIIAIAKWMWD